MLDSQVVGLSRDGGFCPLSIGDFSSLPWLSSSGFLIRRPRFMRRNCKEIAETDLDQGRKDEIGFLLCKFLSCCHFLSGVLAIQALRPVSRDGAASRVSGPAPSSSLTTTTGLRAFSLTGHTLQMGRRQISERCGYGPCCSRARTSGDLLRAGPSSLRIDH